MCPVHADFCAWQHAGGEVCYLNMHLRALLPVSISSERVHVFCMYICRQNALSGPLCGSRWGNRPLKLCGNARVSCFCCLYIVAMQLILHACTCVRFLVLWNAWTLKLLVSSKFIPLHFWCTFAFLVQFCCVVIALRAKGAQLSVRVRYACTFPDVLTSHCSWRCMDFCLERLALVYIFLLTYVQQ